MTDRFPVDTAKDEPTWIKNAGRNAWPDAATDWNESTYAVGPNHGATGWNETLYAVKPNESAQNTWDASLYATGAKQEVNGWALSLYAVKPRVYLYFFVFASSGWVCSNSAMSCCRSAGGSTPPDQTADPAYHLYAVPSEEHTSDNVGPFNESSF